MTAKNCSYENNIPVGPKHIIIKKFWDIDRKHTALQAFCSDHVKI